MLNSIGPTLEKIPFAQYIGFGWVIILAVIWFFVWYFIIKFFLQGSRHFRASLMALVLLGMGLVFALHKANSPVDWTSGGLNPNRPGFKPQVVILSGTTEHGYFEIRMRGADYYYCRRWNSFEWKHGSWFEMDLSIPGFSMTRALISRPLATQGGGGSWSRSQDLVLARRLWNGTNFIGANPNEMVAEESEWHAREEFRKLKKVGPYLIPREIIFSDGLDSGGHYWGETGTYTIKKVEFWNQPSTNWFWAVKRQHFDYGSFERTNDLHEPGLILGKK